MTLLSFFLNLFSFKNRYLKSVVYREQKLKIGVLTSIFLCVMYILEWEFFMDEILEILNKSGLNYSKESVKSRLERAKYWLDKYNPEKKIQMRENINEVYITGMEEERKALVRELRQYVQDKENFTIEEVTEVLYDIPKKGEENKKLVQEKQKSFYQDLYNLQHIAL